MATQSGRILFGAIDRIVNSPANYRVAMLCDLAAALAFLVLGVTRFSGPFVVAGGLIIVGIMSFGIHGVGGTVSFIQYDLIVHRRR
jgi:hypothetical protein